MTPAAFRAEQDRLGLTQGQMGVLLGVRDRTVRLWLAEDSVPRAVALLLPRLTKAEAKRLLKDGLSGAQGEARASTGTPDEK